MMKRQMDCEQIHKLLTEYRPVDEVSALLEGQSHLADCIETGLRRALKLRRWCEFEAYTWASGAFPSDRFTPMLIDALDLHDPHAQPAEILLALARIGDSRSVESVRRALLWTPEWDEFHDLALKAIDALLEIDNAAAWKVIEEAAANDRRMRIRNLCRKLLRRRH